jgi:hypothetical protein
MEESRIIAYERPLAEAVVIKLEGIVCATGEVPDMEHGWDLDF